MAKKKENSTPPEQKTCVLCGKRYPFSDPSCIVGQTGRIVCSDCIGISRKILQAPSSNQKPASNSNISQILTPNQIIQKLDDVIIGQEQAKKAVSVALWKQQLRAAGDSTIPRGNLLLYGPTGCGKTALVREAAKIVDLPFISFDATTLTETGYRGRDAQDMIKELVTRFEGHPKLSSGIVFLDEADKLAARGSESRTVYNQGTQHSLLKLVEGMEVSLDNGFSISTEGLLFVFGGAFTDLACKKEAENHVRTIGFDRGCSPKIESEFTSSDFASYGMEPELLGRIGQYVPVKKLTKEELLQILFESRLSVFRQYQTFFLSHGIRLQLSQKQADVLADAALSRGTGARGLNVLVEELIQPLLFALSEGQLHTHAELGGSVYAK